MKCALWIALAGAACGDNSEPPEDPPVDIRSSILELHGSPTRAGAYIAPELTHAAAAGMRIDRLFVPPSYQGAVYAQPLYLDTGGADDLFIVATELNEVMAYRMNNQLAWRRVLGAPQNMPNDAEGAPCGNISPLGITGTPVIDYAQRTLYLDAMIRQAGRASHRIFALSLDDGSTRPGWPVDVGERVGEPIRFRPAAQNQRGALTFHRGRVYVPYGGHAGDCGDYHGWVVSVHRDSPARPTGFATESSYAGTWMPGGVTSDGTHMFAVFGNGEIGSPSWKQSSMVARLGEGATFSRTTQDFWVPPNWQELDDLDIDLTGPATVLDLEGATPSQLLIATGKDGKVYLLDRTNLGGISEPVASLKVATNEIISVSALYRTTLGTYLVLRGHGIAECPGVSTFSALVAVKIEPGAPPRLSVAWCAGIGLIGSPIATTTDGTRDPIVWAFGAEGDGLLHGFDGDTGAEIFAGGDEAVMPSSRFITPIYVRGRILVAATGRLVAWTP
jgi:hypothetical protein